MTSFHSQVRGMLRLLAISTMTFSISVTSAAAGEAAAGEAAAGEAAAGEAAAGESAADIRSWIEQFSADLDTLRHRYQVPMDDEAMRLRRQTMQDWLTKLQDVDFERLDQAAKVDFLLLRSELEYRLEKQELDRDRDRRASEFLPYAETLVAVCKRREDVQPIEPRELASKLDEVAERIESTIADLKQPATEDESASQVQQRLDALRASELIRDLKRSIDELHRFYSGYNPLYTWWAKQPMDQLQKSLDEHRKVLRETVVGVPDSDNDTIIGLPIGAAGLELELRHEWIAHTPEELVALAKREMAWCDEQMAKASRELGYGEDWRAAMEFVKSKHVAPGEQPQMIRELAWEAIRFLKANDLLTIPPLAENGWRMRMMSPERQRVNPYFLGGDTIIVSYPTDSMTHDEKLMSMRSNNEHFSRATVHHELIPGHHLQYYMLPRYRSYRSLFRTPFWIEGWALYWEMLLWDLGFAHGPEDRVGMLFWRKHRCARIIFSLSYHLGTMTPEECVDYLVERVGHERSAATAEVRRSIMGGYSPLYQAAYMLGGLQLRSMHKELVQSGKMTNREFHDAILHQHCIPIELLRAYLVEQPLTADQRPSWRFAAAAE
jgi:uncharacterized protein (DUF885 family)